MSLWVVLGIIFVIWLWRQIRKVRVTPQMLREEIKEKEAAGIQPTVVDLVANGTPHETRDPEQVHAVLEDMIGRREAYIHGVDAHGRPLYGTQKPERQRRWW